MPHFLDRIDYTYTQHPIEFAPYRYKEDMLPSDYFHRNVFLSFQQGRFGDKAEGNHRGGQPPVGLCPTLIQKGTFQKSQQILQEILADCTGGGEGKDRGSKRGQGVRPLGPAAAVGRVARLPLPPKEQGGQVGGTLSIPIQTPSNIPAENRRRWRASMDTYRIISSDYDVIEPPDLWISREDDTHP